MNRAGRLAAGLIVALQLAYAIVLAAGLAALPSAEAPIPDPYFTAMELLILLIAPLLVIPDGGLAFSRTADAKAFQPLCSGVHGHVRSSQLPRPFPDPHHQP
jgi:hypothetical protein